MSVVPYKQSTESKKEQVAKMFDNISKRYDFLNHFLSLGIDIGWRRKAIRLLQNKKPKSILDVATGTADFALEATRLNPDRIVGIDISDGMLEVGREKIRDKNLQEKIVLENGDSENIKYEENTFDAVIVSFGVRNFENLDKGLENIFRVLKPNGTVSIIEFSQPTTFPFKQLYFFYFKYILPLIGRIVSKDQSAYTYLPESVSQFPYGEQFTQRLEMAGFVNTQIIPLTFGISSIYMAEKTGNVK
jgi:demethylmenaquinone methyltransferase/2-methoxy-6-polyprenyl-1,4-benzoquinol methylase